MIATTTASTAMCSSAPAAPATVGLTLPAAVPLTLLVGPPGVGRSRALRALRRAAEQAGEPVLELRLAAEDRDEAWYLAGALLAGLSPLPTRLSAGRGTAVEPPTATLSRALRGRPGLTIFVDDAQWADPSSAAALLTALYGLGGAGIRCVAAVRSGLGRGAAADRATAGVAAAFNRLRSAGSVRIIPVRPLGPAESDTLVATILGAPPDSALRDELRRLSLGRPAALIAAAQGYLGSPALRVSDRRAYLTDPTVSPRIPADHRLLASARGLAADTFTVARALAVLQHLGPATVPLLARVTERTPTQLNEDLAALRGAGVAGCHRQGWRITVPAVTVALIACLGPYERRRLAQAAVEAIWSGEAVCADPDFLPDQVAAAGRMVDPQRAAALLRASARATEVTRPSAAARWSSAAADLGTAPQDRAEALLAVAAAALHAGEYAAAEPPLRELLTGSGAGGGARPDASAGGLPAAVRQEAELLALVRACGVDATATIQSVAAGDHWWAGTARPTVVTRAAALGLLDRWSEAAGLLQASSGLEVAGRSEALGAGEALDPLCGLVLAQVAAATGRSDLPTPESEPVDSTEPVPTEPVPTEPVGAERRRVTAALGRCCLAISVGDTVAAERWLIAADLPSADLPAPERCLADWHGGRWTQALTAAQAGIAAGLVTSRLTAAAVYRAGAEVLTGQGWPARARTMLDAGRSRGLPLWHLATPALVDLDRVVGDVGSATRTAEQALAAATRSGAVVGTDELWMLTAELAAQRGDLAAARAAADEATAVAALVGGAAALLRAATARLVAGHPGGDAQEVLRLARLLGRPAELARACEQVVRCTGGHPELLAEAYELYGDLGAILHRSRVRQAMREHGLPVPGRADTLAEGEQLLAVLVAEGLSNRQLAAATQSSEKSVEGRLSRLFTRTGYRSRVELAAAVLVGDYRVG